MSDTQPLSPTSNSFFAPVFRFAEFLQKSVLVNISVEMSVASGKQNENSHNLRKQMVNWGERPEERLHKNSANWIVLSNLIRKTNI